MKQSITGLANKATGREVKKSARLGGYGDRLRTVQMTEVSAIQTNSIFPNQRLPWKRRHKNILRYF